MRTRTGWSMRLQHYFADFPSPLLFQNGNSKARATIRVSSTFWSARRTLLYNFPIPCGSPLLQKKANPGKLNRKSSFLIMRYQVGSDDPLSPLKNPHKKIVLSGMSLWRQTCYEDLHHHDERDLLSFLLKMHPVRFPIQYFLSQRISLCQKNYRNNVLLKAKNWVVR